MLKQKSSQLLPSCHFFIRISLTWSFFGGWQAGDLPKRFRDDKKSSRARLGLTAHCLIITLQGNCGCYKKRHWFSSKRNIHMGKSALYSYLAVCPCWQWYSTSDGNRLLPPTEIYSEKLDFNSPRTFWPHWRWSIDEVLQPVSQKSGRPFALVRYAKSSKASIQNSLDYMNNEFQKGLAINPSINMHKKNNGSKPTWPGSSSHVVVQEFQVPTTSELGSR